MHDKRSLRKDEPLGDLIQDWHEDQLIEQWIAPYAEDLSNDTAHLQPRADHRLLVSCDALIETVHFLRSAPPAWVGQKAVRVNASDIVADGGRPRWLTLSLSLPAQLPIAWLKEFMAGVGAACRDLDLKLVGGDTTRAPDYVAISITVLGEVAPHLAVTRGGARPDHLIAVTGTLGDSHLGLDVMLNGLPEADETQKRLLFRHFHPPDRGNFARAAAAQGYLSAMMDLSDGLGVDLPRLCRASSVGAQVALDKLPLSDAARARFEPEDVPACGEDFELLLTCPPQHQAALTALAQAGKTPLHFIGTCSATREITWLHEGRRRRPRTGWSHFATATESTETKRETGRPKQA